MNSASPPPLTWTSMKPGASQAPAGSRSTGHPCGRRPSGKTDAMQPSSMTTTWSCRTVSPSNRWSAWTALAKAVIGCGSPCSGDAAGRRRSRASPQAATPCRKSSAGGRSRPPPADPARAPAALRPPRRGPATNSAAPLPRRSSASCRRPGAASSFGISIRIGYRLETSETGPCRNSAPLKASACRFEVSLSLRAASRAIDRVGPRPIVTRLSAVARLGRAGLQSSAVAAASRSGKRSSAAVASAVLGPEGDEAQERAHRGDDGFRRGDAELRSGRDRQDDVAGRGKRAVGRVHQRRRDGRLRPSPRRRARRGRRCARIATRPGKAGRSSVRLRR